MEIISIKHHFYYFKMNLQVPCTSFENTTLVPILLEPGDLKAFKKMKARNLEKQHFFVQEPTAVRLYKLLIVF